ncbi:MAG: hypothetical protein ACJ780_30180 [Solirubrobacteraceae bacterium]
MRKRRFARAAALAAGIAATGCGSGSTSATTGPGSFRDGFSTSQNEFRKLGTTIARDITDAGAQNNATLATTFSRLAKRADQQATQLAELRVPARYKQQVASLVAGFHAVRGDLSKISSAAAHRDASSAEAAARTLLRDAAGIKTLDTALSKALGLPPPSGARASTTSSG